MANTNAAGSESVPGKDDEHRQAETACVLGRLDLCCVTLASVGRRVVINASVIVKSVSVRCSDIEQRERDAVRRRDHLCPLVVPKNSLASAQRTDAKRSQTNWRRFMSELVKPRCDGLSILALALEGPVFVRLLVSRDFET